MFSQVSSFRIVKYCFFLVALFSSLLGNAGSCTDTLLADGQNFVEMRGRVYEAMGQQNNEVKTVLDSAEVNVMNEAGKSVMIGYSDSKGRIIFKLPLCRKFTISFTKNGFIKKIISVDTNVPKADRKDFVFAYDVDIFEKVEGLDVSILSQPVAKVVFKPFDKTFTYDAAYTNKVNSGLQKMYREYYAILKKEQMASDTLTTKPAPAKSVGTKKSVPYGKDSKPH